VIPAAASVLALVLLLISGIREGIALAYFSTAVFVFVTISWNIGGVFFARLKEDGAGILKSGFRFASTSARLIAGGLVHAGLVLVLIGIISSSFYSREETFVVKEGGVFQMEDYTLTLKRVREERDQVKDMVITEVEVIRNGKITGILSPQKHFHRNHEQPMTEIALDQSLSRDLYLILYGWDGDGNFSFRVIINPLIGLIWWGVVLMCLAGAWRMTSVLLERDRGRFSMQAGPFGRS